MTLTVFDYCLLALILVVAVKVTLTGFITEFFSKASVIVGTAGAILFYRKLSPLVARFLGTEGFPDVISFLVIFLVLYLAVKLIQQLAGTAFEGETMTNLDRSLGFFLGIAEGVLLVFMILFVLRFQPWLDAASFTKGSVLAGILEPFLSEGRGFFPELFRQSSI